MNKRKYPFFNLELNDKVVIDAKYQLVKAAADKHRERHGSMFLVSQVEDKVQILRFK